jgi:hypothetical protein
MLNYAEKDGSLEGIRICPDASSFNHLLFADDSLILLKVSEECSLHLRNILNLNEVCSGQTINTDKSSIVFSKNTSRRDRDRMMSALGITCERRNGKYLGLPVYVDKSRAKTFAYLKDRIWKAI